MSEDKEKNEEIKEKKESKKAGAINLMTPVDDNKEDKKESKSEKIDLSPVIESIKEGFKELSNSLKPKKENIPDLTDLKPIEEKQESKLFDDYDLF